MLKRSSLLFSTLLLVACAQPATLPHRPSVNPSPSLAPGSSITPPQSGSIWTQADLEVTADCLAFSGDPGAKQLSSSVNSSLIALERTKSAPGFNRAAFQVQLDTLGRSLSNARAQGSLTSAAGACIKY